MSFIIVYGSADATSRLKFGSSIEGVVRKELSLDPTDPDYISVIVPEGLYRGSFDYAVVVKCDDEPARQERKNEIGAAIQLAGQEVLNLKGEGERCGVYLDLTNGYWAQ